MKTRYLLIVLLFTLSACGFHLRGSQSNVALEVSHIYIAVNGANKVGAEVRSQMDDDGDAIVRKVEDAKFILRLEREFFDQNVLSVSSGTGKVEEYQITLTVYMSVLSADGKELAVDEKITMSRDFIFDEDAVLGKGSEEEILREELASQAASQIIRRLNALARNN